MLCAVDLQSLSEMWLWPRFRELCFVSWDELQRHYVHALLGLPSLNGRTSYPKISRSLEAARFWFGLIQSLWNLTGISTAALPRCLSNFRAMRSLQYPTSRLRDFTRSCGKTSVCLLNRVRTISSIIYEHMFESWKNPQCSCVKTNTPQYMCCRGMYTVFHWFDMKKK